MILLNKIKNKLTILLVATLLFPSIFNFIHQFESHEHIACGEVKSHFHKTINECNSCDFNLLSFDFILVDNFETNENQIFKIKKIDFTSVFLNLFNSNNKQLRAPPCIS